MHIAHVLTRFAPLVLAFCIWTGSARADSQPGPPPLQAAVEKLSAALTKITLEVTDRRTNGWVYQARSATRAAVDDKGNFGIIIDSESSNMDPQGKFERLSKHKISMIMPLETFRESTIAPSKTTGRDGRGVTRSVQIQAPQERLDVSIILKSFEQSYGKTLEDSENSFPSHTLSINLADDGTPALINGLVLEVQKVLVAEHKATPAPAK